MSTTEEQKKQNRERQQRHREREKQKRDNTIEAQQDAHERAVRTSRNPHFSGESSPGHNAQTFAEELQIHREFLRSLGKPDVTPGETLRMVAKRTYEAWLAGPYAWKSYVPAFNRAAQQFDPDFGFEVSGNFEQTWEPPKDCTGNEPIDIAGLPGLPIIRKD